MGSEDIPDFNMSLEFAVYFVTATINGHASFQFHPETSIDGPILRGTLRLAVFAGEADGQPSSRLFFNFPNRGGRQLGISYTGIIFRHPETQAELQVDLQAPCFIVSQVGFCSYLISHEVQRSYGASAQLRP